MMADLPRASGSAEVHGGSANTGMVHIKKGGMC